MNCRATLAPSEISKFRATITKISFPELFQNIEISSRSKQQREKKTAVVIQFWSGLFYYWTAVEIKDQMVNFRSVWLDMIHWYEFYGILRTWTFFQETDSDFGCRVKGPSVPFGIFTIEARMYLDSNIFIFTAVVWGRRSPVDVPVDMHDSSRVWFQSQTGRFVGDLRTWNKA